VRFDNGSLGIALLMGMLDHWHVFGAESLASIDMWGAYMHGCA
jgi:hypothetical protein